MHLFQQCVATPLAFVTAEILAAVTPKIVFFFIIYKIYTAICPERTPAMRLCQQCAATVAFVAAKISAKSPQKLFIFIIYEMYLAICRERTPAMHFFQRCVADSIAFVAAEVSAIQVTPKIVYFHYLRNMHCNLPREDTHDAFVSAVGYYPYCFFLGVEGLEALNEQEACRCRSKRRWLSYQRTTFPLC